MQMHIKANANYLITENAFSTSKLTTLAHSSPRSSALISVDEPS